MNNSESLEYPPFTDIKALHKQTFPLLDGKSIEITILLYGAKIERHKPNTQHNGIAVCTEYGDLIVDDLYVEESPSHVPTERQKSLFADLTQYDNFPRFAETVNELGKSADRLRTEL